MMNFIGNEKIEMSEEHFRAISARATNIEHEYAMVTTDFNRGIVNSLRGMVSELRMMALCMRQADRDTECENQMQSAYINELQQKLDEAEIEHKREFDKAS